MSGKLEDASETERWEADKVQDEQPSALGALLGAGQPRCRVLADISVHWYPSDSKPGDACLCGATVRRKS
jgi:hypothetical protein